MGRIRNMLGRLIGFVRNKDGQLTMSFAATMTPAVMIVGGAVDFGLAISARTELQGAADAAAIAGAAMPDGTSDQARIDRALQVFIANRKPFDAEAAGPSISVVDGKVTVTVSENMPTNFLGIMQLTSLTIDAASTASSGYEYSNDPTSLGKVCLLALDPASDDGIHIQGDNDVKYLNCWGYTNSTKATAVNANGSNATAEGEGTCAVGGYDAEHDNFSPTPRTGCTTTPDPFATVSAYHPTQSYVPNFTPPTIPTVCKASNVNLKKGTFTLQPGRYCGGINIQAHAKVTFEPGEYIIDNGHFNVQSGSTITGTNVLFYFSGANARMTIIGGGTVNMKGRQTGSSYAGFLMIQHPDAWRGLESNIQGGGTFNLEGLIYMPTQRIEVSGNGDVNTNTSYFGMIAKDFYFRGNGKFYLKKQGSSGAPTMPEIMPDVPRQQSRSARLE